MNIPDDFFTGSSALSLEFRKLTFGIASESAGQSNFSGQSMSAYPSLPVAVVTALAVYLFLGVSLALFITSLARSLRTYQIHREVIREQPFLQARMLERTCLHEQYGAVENRNSGVDMGAVPSKPLVAHNLLVKSPPLLAAVTYNSS